MTLQALPDPRQDLHQATQTAASLRAEVGDNTFFGPIPDELRPDYQGNGESGLTFSSASAKRTSKQSPKAKKRNVLPLLFGLLLVLVIALPLAWLTLTEQGKSFYLEQLSPRFANLFSQPEVDSTETVTPDLQPLPNTTQTGSFSLKVEACIDADNLEPYNCQQTEAAFPGISINIQSTRETLQLQENRQAQKQSFLVEALPQGRYSIILDDSRTGLKRCPQSSPTLNPAGNPLRLSLQENTTILFVYCANTG